MEFDDIALEKHLLALFDQNPDLARALALSRRVHGQAVRDEGTPYICHPIRVALILVEEIGVCDLDLACAALLHDVLEDGPDMRAEDIEQAFGARVARLVECLTDEFKNSGLPRRERKALYLRRVAAASDDCLLIKLCDRLDNLRSLPYIADTEKQARIRQDTREHLMPELAGRGPAFEPMARLLGEALNG